MKLKDKDNTAWQKYAAGAISIVCFLIIWQLVVSFTRVGLVMVGPIEVIKSFCSAFVSPIGRNTIQSHIVWSMTRVMIGFFMGSILGIVLGICMGWNKNVESFFRPLFELLDLFLQLHGFLFLSFGSEQESHQSISSSF